MLNSQDRSKAFNFALKAQDIFGFLIGLTVLWSIYALNFTQIDLAFISKILLTLISMDHHLQNLSTELRDLFHLI